ncbi:ABC transporter substrate-binding protein [Candidatus Izimaplasma bacterium]|nr:ABC transporter substrate-binding protein [Candidatus Izimaplasma bacterium]
MKKIYLFVLVLLVFGLSACVTTEYAVVFESNGGSAIEEMVVEDGSSFLAHTTPTKEGHVFTGWYSDSLLNNYYDFTTAVVGDLNLYAKWELEEYTVTFESNGGSEINDSVFLFETLITEPDEPVYEGYIFTGWASSDDITSLFDFSVEQTEDVTLHAVWTPKQYSVVYYTMLGLVLDEVIYSYNDILTAVLMPSGPEIDGYTFDSWNIELPTTMPANNLDIHPNYLINQYTITFETDGGETLEPLPLNYLEEVNLPTPVNEGMIFDGWYINPDLTAEFNITYMIDLDLTLYAKWIDEYSPLSGVLNWNIGREPYNIDPGLNGGSDSGDVIMQTFEGLVREINGVVYPGIAESWVTSTDGLTITFHLRESNWSDGTPLTAHDFVYSWLRAMNPDTMSEYSWIWDYTNVVGAADFVFGSGDASIVGITAVNDLTLEVQLTKPTHYFVSLMSFYHFMPVKQSAVESGIDGTWAKDPQLVVSNGPFVLSDYIIGSQLVLLKNEQYWNTSNVEINRINGYFIDSRFAAYAEYEKGNLDIIPDVSLSQISNLLVESGEYYVFPRLGTYYYNFNMDRDQSGTNTDHVLDGIWANVNLRKALSYAIDRDSIGENLGFPFVPAVGFIPPGFLDDDGFDFFETAGTYEMVSDDGNFDQAVTLFATAAAEMGMTVAELRSHIENNEELLYNTSDSHNYIAELVQGMWEDTLGFTIPLANEEWALFQQTRASGDYSISRGGWLTDFMDPSGLIAIFGSMSYYNDPNYYNTEFDTLLSEANFATNDAIHFQKLYEAYGVFMNDMPIVPIYHYSDSMLVKNRVTGWGRSVLGTIDFSRATVTGSTSTEEE